MHSAGDVISYLEMCQAEGTSLQRGMNFRLRGEYSVILMSRRTGAPYVDRVEDEGRVLIYEGHDIPRHRGGPDPKRVDQIAHNPSGSLTQNGLFLKAVDEYKHGSRDPEIVRVYEKIRDGIWVFNGLFHLVDAWQEASSNRRVFKFRLEIMEDESPVSTHSLEALGHNRMIPSSVKLQVWKRDRGQCRICGSVDNLHFDHIIPFSKGGSSLVVDNIQLLCARHNLAKSDRIE